MKAKKLSIFFLMLAFTVVNNLQASDKTVKFRAESMHCGGCAGKIKKAVSALDGVSDFSANLEQRVVSISYDDQKVNTEQLKEAIVALKHQAEDYDPNEIIVRKVSFKAGQIGCGGCVAKVKKNIGAETGVIGVDVDLSTKEVIVEYDAHKLSAKEIKQDFQKFNYTVTRYWKSEKVQYALFEVDQIDNAGEIEENLSKEKNIFDVSVNSRTKHIAIAYNAAKITEEALGEQIKKYNLNLVAAN